MVKYLKNTFKNNLKKFQISSSKILKDFSNTLRTDSIKGFNKFPSKQDSCNELHYRGLKTEKTENEYNNTVDDQAEINDKVETTSNIAGTFDKKTKIKNSKSLNQSQYQNLGIGNNKIKN